MRRRLSKAVCRPNILSGMMYAYGRGVAPDATKGKAFFTKVVEDYKRPALVADGSSNLDVEDPYSRSDVRNLARGQLEIINAKFIRDNYNNNDNTAVWLGIATVAILALISGSSNSPSSSGASNAAAQQYEESQEQERERNQELNEELGQQILNDNGEH